MESLVNSIVSNLELSVKTKSPPYSTLTSQRFITSGFKSIKSRQLNDQLTVPH